MNLKSKLHENFLRVKKRIETELQKSNRLANSVKLLAVSKRHRKESIRELYELGQRYFGENYAQELVDKVSSLSDLNISWAFIGQLQSNKIKKIVAHASEIQSVTNLKEAQLINKYSLGFKKKDYPIYICVKLFPEKNKKGVAAEDLAALRQEILTSCPNLALQGVMAIPPPIATLDIHPQSMIPIAYTQFYELAKETGEGRMSIGMSNDLEEAIRAGSHVVRIGSALFGPRED